MPVTPGYTFTQTATHVTVSVALPGGVGKAYDVFVSPHFVKMNVPPTHLLELDLYGEVASAPAGYDAAAAAAGDPKAADAKVAPAPAPAGKAAGDSYTLRAAPNGLELVLTKAKAGAWAALQFDGAKAERLRRRESSIATQQRLQSLRDAHVAAQAKRSAQAAVEAGWDFHAQQKDAIKHLSTAAATTAKDDVTAWANALRATDATVGTLGRAPTGPAVAPATATKAPPKPEPKGAYLEEIDEDAERKEAEAAAKAAEEAAKAEAEAAAQAAQAAAQRKAKALADAQRNVWEPQQPQPQAAANSNSSAAAAATKSDALPPVRSYARVEVKFTARPGPLTATAAREDSDRKTLKSIANWALRNQPAWLSGAAPLHPDAVALKDRADRFFRLSDFASAVSAYSSCIQIQTAGNAQYAAAAGGACPPSLYANRSACHLAMAKRANPNADPDSAAAIAAATAPAASASSASAADSKAAAAAAAASSASSAAAVASVGDSELGQYRVRLKLCVRDCNKVLELIGGVAEPPQPLLVMQHKTLLRRGTALWWLGALGSALSDHKQALALGREKKLYSSDAAAAPAAVGGAPASPAAPAAGTAEAAVEASIATLTALHEHVTVHSAHLTYKAEGNEHYARKAYADAIRCYSQSLQLYPLSLVCLSNRAMCHLATEPPALADCIRDCSHALLLWEDSELVRGSRAELHDRRTARLERWTKYRAERAKEKAMRKLMSQQQAAAEGFADPQLTGLPALPAPESRPKKSKKKAADPSAGGKGDGAGTGDDDEDDSSDDEPEPAEVDPLYSEVSDGHFSGGNGLGLDSADGDCVGPDQDVQLRANAPHASRDVFVVKVLNRRACAYVCAEQYDLAAADYRRGVGLLEAAQEALSAAIAAETKSGGNSGAGECCVKAHGGSVAACMRSTELKLRALHATLTAEQRLVGVQCELTRTLALAAFALADEKKYDKAKAMYSALEQSLMTNARSGGGAKALAVGGAAGSAPNRKFEALRAEWASYYLPLIHCNRSACALALSELGAASRDAERAIDALGGAATPAAAAATAAAPDRVLAAAWAVVRAERKARAATIGSAASMAAAAEAKALDARLHSAWADAAPSRAARASRTLECVLFALTRRGTARAYRGLLVDARADMLDAQALYRAVSPLAAAGLHFAALTPAAWATVEADAAKLDAVARRYGVV